MPKYIYCQLEQKLFRVLEKQDPDISAYDLATIITQAADELSIQAQVRSGNVRTLFLAPGAPSPYEGCWVVHVETNKVPLGCEELSPRQRMSDYLIPAI